MNKQEGGLYSEEPRVRTLNQVSLLKHAAREVTAQLIVNFGQRCDSPLVVSHSRTVLSLRVLTKDIEQDMESFPMRSSRASSERAHLRR
jgi:hypothetical protein